MKLLHRSYLWPPLIKSSLGPVDQICCDHAGDGKYKDADENLIGLERRASHGNHKPNPRGSSIDSPTMTPMSALPIPSRKPVRMNGTVEGITTLLKSCHSDAPKLLAAVRRLCGVVFTPSDVDDQRKYRPEKNNADFRENPNT